MRFDWTEFLRLAVDLAGRTTDEAARRSAVSRGYYAAFGVARDFAVRELHFIPTGRADDHRKVTDLLYRRGWGELASRLDKARVHHRSYGPWL